MLNLEDLYRQILMNIPEEDAERHGLLKTPHRAAEALKFLTSGYEANITEIVNDAIFSDGNADELVLVKDIGFHSLCEHHILPFSGKCHVAYIPQDNKVIGLSKIPRIVDVFARRLQVQERLTGQIAETLKELLNPKGVAVVCEAQHSCMTMRGVQKHGASMSTSSMLGVFREKPEARAELLSMINNK